MEWISVDKRPPKKDKEVLVITEQRERMVAWLSLEFKEPVWVLTPSGEIYREEFGKVTHWAEMPEPPKEDDDVLLFSHLDFRFCSGLYCGNCKGGRMTVIKILNSPKATIIPCIHEGSGCSGLFNTITNEFYPVETTEIKYIRSSETQYIDTGV